jgi:hypothetical protein
MHPCWTSLIMISHNPWRMSSCHRRGRNDGGATSGGETLNKTHNNQSLNTNGVVATDYKGSIDMGTLLDTPLLGSDMIHGRKAKIRCHSTWTSSRKLDLFHKFRLTQILVVYETSPVGKIISLSFQWVHESPDWISYATWAPVWFTSF